MNRNYEEWLKYYENATKEQVIEDMMLDINNIKEKDKEIERLSKEVDMWNRKYNEQIDILNELENYCLSWKENDKYCYLSSNDKDKCRYDIWNEVLDKLKELKGNKE